MELLLVVLVRIVSKFSSILYAILCYNPVIIVLNSKQNVT